MSLIWENAHLDLDRVAYDRAKAELGTGADVRSLLNRATEIKAELQRKGN